MGLKNAVACIRKHKHFLITAHTNMEGDALGSELAMYILLKKMGKAAVIMNEDDLPYGYEFLPYKQSIKKFMRKKTDKIKFDCFMVLDCADLKRTGEVYGLNTEQRTVLNIDHHISNQAFADVNWIEPYASSTCELIFKLYKALRVPLDKNAALCLYLGILTDTGSFRYSNTTSAVHGMVSELLKYNLDVKGIYKSVYENIPYNDMLVLTKILPNIRRSADGKVVWFQVERKMLKERKMSFDLTENILTFARAIKDVQVAALFKENFGAKNEIRVNLRSQGKVDVNRIASLFGGGGHKTASGATVKGNINQVRRHVLEKIEEALRNESFRRPEQNKRVP